MVSQEVGLLVEGLQRERKLVTVHFSTTLAPQHFYPSSNSDNLCVKIATYKKYNSRGLVGVTGGGGHLGIDNKVGKPNTGGGGMGCYGYQRYDTTCMFEHVTPTELETWGADGGSGIFFIVFDKCPCNQQGV